MLREHRDRRTRIFYHLAYLVTDGACSNLYYLVPGSHSYPQVSIWPYTCWTPREGMSNPRLTIVTVIDGLPKRYRTAIWNNRMHYAARHGHRWGGAGGGCTWGEKCAWGGGARQGWGHLRGMLLGDELVWGAGGVGAQ